MRIVLSDDPRDFARRDWSTVVEADPDGTFFHTPQYLKLYWEEFGGEAGLLLAFGEEEGRTVGAAAFELDRGTLRCLGGTEVTDYGGPVAFPEAADRFAAELAVALAGLDGWSGGDLQGLTEDSAWLPRLQRAGTAAGLRTEVVEDDVSPYVPAAPSFDAYLERLPGKLRHELRRKARRLETEAGTRRLVFASSETLGADLNTFVAWHKASGGSKGRFMQPGMEIFFRRLGEAFVERGTFRLAFLEVAEGKLAGAIGFAFGGRFHLYNSAFDRSRRDLAPGMVLVADLLEWAFEAGCGEFDMLKGDLAYKYRFGARRRAVKRLLLRR